MQKFIKALSQPFQKAAEAGMTIIEILIVIGLIGTLMGIIMTTLIERGDDAKVDLAKVAIGKLGDGLKLYKVHNNHLPTTEEGLQALIEAPASAKRWRGPYSDAEKLNDPWDVPYTYERVPGQPGYKITSAGPDGEAGTEDDISFPEGQKQTQEDAPISVELKVPTDTGNVNESTE